MFEVRFEVRISRFIVLFKFQSSLFYYSSIQLSLRQRTLNAFVLNAGYAETEGSGSFFPFPHLIIGKKKLKKGITF
jgi:hypothetical protein